MQSETSSLPAPITAYFKAANAGEPARAAACFAASAEVVDENATHRGRAAIAAWVAQATAKYHPQAEILHASEACGVTHVTARVSGSFPGSPVELGFAFTLENAVIIRLEIS